MTEKKKINLGPLPEELDLSKYEETVTRWDRVIAVAVAALLLIGLLIYLFWPASEHDAESGKMADTSLPVGNVQTVEEGSGSALSENLQVPPAQNTDSTALVIQPEPSADQKDQAFEGESTSTVVDEQTEDMALPTKESEVSQASPAIVRILNPAIKQAVLTLEMNNKTPGESLSAELRLPASGITKVILFTEMQGLRGQTLYHDWYRNGKRQARVKIPVNVHNQSSFSSKFINTQMTGDWKVKVVDVKLNLYVEADFKVRAP